MTALDRAARALAMHDGQGHYFDLPICQCDQCSRERADERSVYLDRAKAVLAALDPPSPGMVEAGLLAMTRDVVESGDVEAVWAAMLAAAREGA